MNRMSTVIRCPASELPDWFHSLALDMGLPDRLADLGVEQSDLDPLADAAIADHSTATNPAPMTTEDCATMYTAAL